MPLNYPHTCPDIDKSISAFKDDIESYLSDMLDECCPLLEGEQKQAFMKEHVSLIHDNFSDHFEDVRKTNEDMRREADNQIDYAEYNLSEAESRIEELENEKENNPSR